MAADSPPISPARFSPQDRSPWWATVRATRRVLVMAPTMTSIKRLMDIAALLQGDVRVQLVFTVPPNVFNRGAARMLAALGAPLVPWEQVVRESFDLAVTANFGHIENVDAPVVVFSHGASRNSLARPRRRGALPVLGPVLGFSPSELIRGGMLVPSALALGHDRELRLLEEGCPQALPAARVVGDPCYDRLIAGGGMRESYRRALGLEPEQQLVVAASTWRQNSLLGSATPLLERLVRELPAPDYRIVLLTHPNIWAVHGEYQLRAWLAPYAARGLVVAGPDADWQPLLLAADWIVGDHGSVTLYGAATGVPVLLGAFPEQDVHPHSGAAALGALAPRLSDGVSIPAQLKHAADVFDADAMAQVAALISSEPGGFARHARRLLYGLLETGQPATPACLPAAPLPPSLDEFMGAPQVRVAL
ncbi:hypothetical protein [Actinocrinis sp.]|uniref:hypothetical protein n=1 Tax=Actinocrinis sp. TaxID=1920516 RepID=UPI002D6E7892|nr:hypothetical protein [Actinocrinis sp.]HZP53134.1 hypothetical protein [Actinocrinis sp.]